MGGDDADRPIQLGMSRTPSYAKSPWIRKVSAFLFENPFRTPLDGILRKHPPLCIHRYDTTSTSTRGDANEAQGSIPSKVYAWKRRKKRQEEGRRRSGASVPAPVPAGQSRSQLRSDRNPNRRSPVQVRHYRRGFRLPARLPARLKSGTTEGVSGCQPGCQTG